MVSIEDLPEELLVEIFKYAASEKGAILTISQVNRHFKIIIDLYWRNLIYLSAIRLELESKKKSLSALNNSSRKYTTARFSVAYVYPKKFELIRSDRVQKGINIISTITNKFWKTLTTIQLESILENGIHALQIINVLRNLINLQSLRLKLLIRTTQNFKDFGAKALNENQYDFPKLRTLHLNTNIKEVCILFQKCKSPPIVDLLVKYHKSVPSLHYYDLLEKFQETVKILRIDGANIDMNFLTQLQQLTKLKVHTLGFSDVGIQCDSVTFSNFMAAQTTVRNFDLKVGGQVHDDFLTGFGKNLNLTKIENLKFSARHGYFNKTNYNPSDDFQLQNVKSLEVDAVFFTIKKNYMRNLLTPSNNLTSLVLNGLFELELTVVAQSFPNLENLDIGVSVTINNNELYYIFRKLKKLKYLKFRFSDNHPFNIEFFKEPEFKLETLRHLAIALTRSTPKIYELYYFCRIFPNVKHLTIDVRLLFHNEIIWALMFLFHMPKTELLSLHFRHILPGNLMEYIPKLFEYKTLKEITIIYYPNGIRDEKKYSRLEYDIDKKLT